MIDNLTLEQLNSEIDQIVLASHPAPERACMIYAMLSSIRLTKMGFLAAPQIGSLQVKVANDPGDNLGDICYSIRMGQGVTNEYHAWSAVLNRDTNEGWILDLSAKYFKINWSQIVGIAGGDHVLWQRNEIGRFVYGDTDYLDREQISYQADESWSHRAQGVYVKLMMESKESVYDIARATALEFPELDHSEVKLKHDPKTGCTTPE